MAEVYLEKLVWNKCRWISLIVSLHWFRQWLGAVRQHAITWVNLDLWLMTRHVQVNLLIHLFGRQYTMLWILVRTLFCEKWLIVKGIIYNLVVSSVTSDDITQLGASYLQIYPYMTNLNILCLNTYSYGWKQGLLQWNLSVTTTSKIKCITCDSFSNVF